MRLTLIHGIHNKDNCHGQHDHAINLRSRVLLFPRKRQNRNGSTGQDDRHVHPSQERSETNASVRNSNSLKESVLCLHHPYLSLAKNTLGSTFIGAARGLSGLTSVITSDFLLLIAPNSFEKRPCSSCFGGKSAIRGPGVS